MFVSQVTLMAEVPSAMAALDAHAGVANVVEHGLVFVSMLAIAEANKVRPRVCVKGRGGKWDVCWRHDLRVEW